MAFSEDLVTLLTSVAVPGKTLFIGAKEAIPVGDGPYVSIIPSGGTGPEYVQNAREPAYRLPTAQITVRSTSFATAFALAVVAFNVLVQIENQTVNGTWYRRIVPLQSEPFDGGEDDKGRPTVKFNVLGNKGS